MNNQLINGDCNMETEYCINGLNTDEHYKCIPWRNSQKGYNKLFENTTLCKKWRYGYWCATSRGYDFCRPSKCDLPNIICTLDKFWTVYKNSIKLDFQKVSKDFDLIIIISSKSTFPKCSIATKCHHCKSTDNLVNNLFGSCFRENIIKLDISTILIKLSGLSSYIIYILPVFKERLYGSLFKLSINKSVKDIINFKNISIKYFSHLSRLVEWQCDNKENFSVIYFVKMFKKGITQHIYSIETTSNLVFLKNLLPNQFYVVNIQINFGIKFENISAYREFNTVSIPSIVLTIQITNKTATSITLQWKPTDQTDENGYAEGYLINMTEPIHKVFNSTNTYISIYHLLPCKRYCFTIIAFNVAGRSNNSEIICGVTRAIFDKINNISVKYRSSTSRIVEWKYDNKHNCNVIFQVDLYKGGIKYELITKETKKKKKKKYKNIKYNIKKIK